MYKMKILFFLTNITDSHYYKHVSALNKLGAEVEILGFKRKHYERKKYDYPYTLLGTIEHLHYFKRLMPILKSTLIVRKRLQTADVVYVFGPDMLALYWLSSLGLRTKVKTVFEVCDIQPILSSNSLLSKAIRLFERILMRKVHLLVVTSEAFITGFFETFLGLTQLRYLVIENKIDSKPPRLPGHEKTKHSLDILRIGYFGVIRCPRSMEILKTAAEKAKGRIRIYIRGVSPINIVDIEACAKENPWIEYGGQYLSPDDCPYMYGNVDIAWVSYPYEGTQVGNWMWARTNRFYEACFYGKPMIAQSGTEDGRVVEEKDLGMCLDPSDINACAEQILTIRPDDLQRWRNNIRQLPENLYIYTDEHQRLLDILNSISSDGSNCILSTKK
jgi:succinoglycan biosynthesis protein ExoL